jgi:hypothetical protein
MLVCVFLCIAAHETAGAARTRLSLRPLVHSEGGNRRKARAHRAARTRMHVLNRCLTFESVYSRRSLILPWRGRVVSHRAKQDAIRGGVTVSPLNRCPNGEITPPRFAFRSASREPTLPLQGRVVAPSTGQAIWRPKHSCDTPRYFIVIASPLRSTLAISPTCRPLNSSTAPFWLVSTIARAPPPTARPAPAAP